MRDDGTLLGIKVRMVMDQGAYSWVPYPATMFAGLMRMLLPGPYRFLGFSFEFTGVATNKCTYVAYRGPWEVETWVRERMLDTVAHELGLDPADVRRLNLLTGEPDDRLVTGLSIAGISSLESLDRALALVDYEGFRREQAEAAHAGPPPGDRLRPLPRTRARSARAAHPSRQRRAGADAARERRPPHRDHRAGTPRPGSRDDAGAARGGRAGCAAPAREGRARRHPHHAGQPHRYRWQPRRDVGERRGGRVDAQAPARRCSPSRRSCSRSRSKTSTSTTA